MRGGTMTPTETVLSALRDLGHNPKSTHDGWLCCCPAHEDRTPSLSIKVGDDGCALVHCHAGCSIDSICEALKLTKAELFTHNNTVNAQRNPKVQATPKQPPKLFGSAKAALEELEKRKGKRSANWVYRNAKGEPVGIIARWDKSEGGKEIRPISRSDDGKSWISGGMTLPRPLYRLTELLAAPASVLVYVVEGEKAADAAVSLGIVATTSPHGSKSAGKADWSPLSGRSVVILPDNDDAGEAYANDVATLAQQAGATAVRIVRLVELWAEMPKGGDIADLLAHYAKSDKSGEQLRSDVETLVGRSVEANAPTVTDGAPMIVRLCDVQPEQVEWLWHGRIALGKLTLIAGDPGLGKSFLTLDMAARVSTGRDWPDCTNKMGAGGVVLLNAEDGIADTIRPRLDAAGADVKQIIAVEAISIVRDNLRTDQRTFDLSQDINALELAIQSVAHCRLVVIDPVTAYLGGVDSHKNAEIRGLLAPLGALATRHGVAVVAVTHLNKSNGGPAIYRAMGSLAFAAAARAAWAVTKDKGDEKRRLFLPIKNNIAPNTGGLAYRIDGLSTGGASVAWEPDPVIESADDALSGDRTNGGEATELDDAANWLREQLSEGSRRTTDVERDAKEAGYSSGTLRRAKARIGAAAVKSAYGGAWEWTLPTPTQSDQPSKAINQGAHSLQDERLRENTAKTYEKPAETPKALKSQGMSAFDERLGSEAVTDWVEV